MNYEELRLWLEVLQFIATIVIGIFAWWRTRETIASHRFCAIEKKFEGMDKKFAGMDKKVGEIDSAVKSGPTCVHHSRMEENDRRLFERLDGINGAINKVDGKLEGIGHTSDLINEFLISQGGK